MGVPEMKSEYKVPGGKLLACEIMVKGGIITDIKLSGDFFMHPETAITELEEAIQGIAIEIIQAKIEDFFQKKEISLFGVSPKDFMTVIQLALSSE
jgi:lipoate-protein ligase A